MSNICFEIGEQLILEDPGTEKSKQKEAVSVSKGPEVHEEFDSGKENLEPDSQSATTK